MSIRDVRRSRFKAEASNPNLVDDLAAFKKKKQPRPLEDAYEPRSIPKLEDERRYRSPNEISKHKIKQHMKKGRSEGLQARYEVYLNQHISDRKSQLKSAQEPSTSERSEHMVRSWVVSSLPTGRQPSLSPSQLPAINKRREGQPRACFVNEKPNKGAFSFELVVGKGGFGKVWRVRHKKSGQLFAMKELKKITVIDRKSVNAILNELRLLTRLHHPFLINAHYAFQDTACLYLALDYVNGGDLRYHMTKQRRFPEEQSRFLIACILVGLEYLHSEKVIHRDLKPENLVFDYKGYLRIIDLGISKEWSRDSGVDTSGTPGYMAPEVITHQKHSYECDYFALGVIVHEMMIGRRPYTGKSRQQIREQMMLRQVILQTVPKGWSDEALDFTNRLLERKPGFRLGSNGGCSQIKSHPWLNGFDWEGLLRIQLMAPFIPTVSIAATQTIEQDYSSYQQANISSEVTSNSTTDLQTALLLKNPIIQSMFEEYELNTDDSSKLQPEIRRRKVRSLSRKD